MRPLSNGGGLVSHQPSLARWIIPRNHDTVQYFRRKVLRELKKIKLAWPGLNYTTAPGVLILLPSTPAIAPASEPLRLAE